MLKPESIAYFQPLINAAKSPKDLADMIEKDHSSMGAIRCNNAINDLQAVTGKYYSNYIDTAYAAINMMAGVNIRYAIAPKHHYDDTYDRLLRITPTCTCDTKALFDNGCTCAYSKWKAEQKTVEMLRDEFHRFVTQNPTVTSIISNPRMEIDFKVSPQTEIDIVSVLQGDSLDAYGARIDLDRGTGESDVAYRERIKEYKRFVLKIKS